MDITAVGKNIWKLRKENGYTQEVLAEKLGVSAPAVSKWENGHALPDTILLVKLAEILECTIDHILLNDSMDKQSIVEMEHDDEQLEQLMHMLLQKIKNENNVGLDNGSIINAFISKHGNVGNISVQRKGCTRTDRHIYQSIRLKVQGRTYHLFEKIIFGRTSELERYQLFEEMGMPIPRVYRIDFEKKLILLDDITVTFLSGTDYDEPGMEGDFYRSSYENIMKAIAVFHSELWENKNAFEKVGLPWHFESVHNLRLHLNGLEQDLINYMKLLPDRLDKKKEAYFRGAIQYLRDNADKIMDEYINAEKHIGLIHGDLHPGHVFVNREDRNKVNFIDFEAVRIGLPTEDLAMLLALHLEPEKKNADNLLRIYFDEFSKYVEDYTYEAFVSDYKLAIMLMMFYPIRLMVSSNIDDKSMLDKAILSYQSFCL